MGYSQAQKAESRQRVLENASRQIREHGIEALGVAECMRSAGLTHGAFYGHFSSRDALILEALEHAVSQSEKRIGSLASGAVKRGETPLQAIAEVFLNERHVKNPGNGCALCALAGEARHANPDVRERLTDYVRRLALQIAQAASGESKDVALAIVATIVGAITLARAVDDDKLARSILSASLALVMTQEGSAR
ncbi:MAG: TetR/AcrR family transcriptional regulator, transcriptional repressor for nem operon [Paraburkholderia sp.]|jgi:TetR/AcrR family transcriptional repressor of nem operon|uniref:TetR/AcrR family transcriptional regulator n=1 Tax=Paraburkholderia sp. TaxID=1926495 RepID=UPI002AFF677C|nr:TetR/AcrR family transcriptional regulator [Paraburkholderia sp.]MEA3084449.1 TetR/AcrR family transcriptional regulator, transcriptional repressor for nem operon [Paraburkholderia sp.]MEA3128944.1 TetR/AcrR family transcriptional regulator, transcriptional repressor for nem operon [Paraburkholderia sp.]